MTLIAYAAFAGICIFIQGIHIFRTGFASPFFRSTSGRKTLSTPYRLANGAMYVLSAMTIIGIVARLLLTRPGGIRRGNIEPAFFLGAPGMAFLVRPDIAVRLGQKSNPDLTQNALTLAFARVIAALLLFGGLLFLTDS